MQQLLDFLLALAIIFLFLILCHVLLRLLWPAWFTIPTGGVILWTLRYVWIGVRSIFEFLAWLVVRTLQASYNLVLLGIDTVSLRLRRRRLRKPMRFAQSRRKI